MQGTIGTLILICKCSKLKMSMTITLKACCKALMGFLFQADSVTVVWKAKLPRFAMLGENDIPFLGICLGMQMASVVFARDVLGLKDAGTTEMHLISGPDH